MLNEGRFAIPIEGIVQARRQSAGLFTVQVPDVPQLEGVEPQGQVVLEMVDHELRVRHVIQRRRGGEQVLLFDQTSGVEIHLHVRPEVAVEHASALVVPKSVGDRMAAAQQGADVIVAPDIEHDVLGPVIAPFFLQHPAVGLIDSKSAHTEVPDRLAKWAARYSCQVSPSLTWWQ